MDAWMQADEAEICSVGQGTSFYRNKIGGWERETRRFQAAHSSIHSHVELSWGDLSFDNIPHEAGGVAEVRAERQEQHFETKYSRPIIDRMTAGGWQ